MDVNVFGMFLCTRAQSTVMVKQDVKPASERGSRGVIVNMGSCSSFVAQPMMGQYTSSKHAVLGLTRNAGKWVPFLTSSVYFSSSLLVLCPCLLELLSLLDSSSPYRREI